MNEQTEDRLCSNICLLYLCKEKNQIGQKLCKLKTLLRDIVMNSRVNFELLLCKQHADQMIKIPIHKILHL